MVLSSDSREEYFHLSLGLQIQNQLCKKEFLMLLEMPCDIQDINLGLADMKQNLHKSGKDLWESFWKSSCRPHRIFYKPLAYIGIIEYLQKSYTGNDCLVSPTKCVWHLTHYMKFTTSEVYIHIMLGFWYTV